MATVNPLYLEDTMPVTSRPRSTRPHTGPTYHPGRTARVVEQAQHIFHELHADGRNALCGVCASQYGPA